MERIKQLRFDSEFIYMDSTEGNVYRLPLSGSPRLLNASNEEREAYSIVLGGNAVRWENIDEDIYITAFYDNKDGSENKIATLFFRFPMVSVAGMAKVLGMNSSLLYQYVYGKKKPSAKREQEVLNAFRNLGAELSQC